MFISPRLTIRDDSYESLLKVIDQKIYIMAARELDNVRFGISSDADISLFSDLETYEEIIKRKLLGCNCLDGVPLEVIANKIRKITKKLC